MAETFQYGSLKNEVVTIPPGRGQPPYQHGGQPAPSAVGQIQWMAPPPSIPGCPPGLEYLTQLDQILVHQQVELFEAFTGIETQNRYQIKNALGQQVFFAFEESELCMRLCCGPGRGFTMHVVNNLNQEVLRMVRPFQCCSGCCWCAGSCDHCSRTIAIESPPGQPIGHVRQRGSSWKAHYEILDANMDPVLKIRGPCWFCQGVCCTCDVDFKVLSLDEDHEVGNITKQWAGFAKECFTKADNFGIQFPMDLDVKMKATLLGALILIEFMFYEQKKNKNNRY
ncbi:phospholipid scramblase 1-like [Apostichopus japonicus]|uniref:phospholipid scramblase 1-like n=1 Tax=Stichopus japonicus TaxID=307972 RepID=UPI003AB64383